MINDSHMVESLLTVKQVADYLKIDKFTVYRLIVQGKLPAYKVGGQWRLNRKMLERWLRQNLNVGQQPPEQKH
jgi:excisionase family DNA binding protein